MAGFGPEVSEHRLDYCHDVVGIDEGGLKVDLGELRLPVGTEVLVAETAGQLEVAVVTGHHQQLFVNLW